eukprot:m.335377 g.335377  ORF g.335377 m.335377 type:complete len:52 (+) comp17579_c0_seq1:170-325(+)
MLFLCYLHCVMAHTVKVVAHGRVIVQGTIAVTHHHRLIVVACHQQMGFAAQ